MLNFSTRCVSGLYFSLFGCTSYSVRRVAVARSSRRHTVLQVLPDWFQHYCWRLHQWPGGVVGYFPACRATEAVTFSRQEQRCTRNSGRTTLPIVFVDVSLSMKLKSHSGKNCKVIYRKNISYCYFDLRSNWNSIVVIVVFTCYSAIMPLLVTCEKNYFKIISAFVDVRLK